MCVCPWLFFKFWITPSKNLPSVNFYNTFILHLEIQNSTVVCLGSHT